MSTTAIIILVLFGITGAVGWVSNIVQIVTTTPFDLSFLMVIKLIGIFVPPLGAAMGIVGFL